MRWLLHEDVPPEEVSWSERDMVQGDLFAGVADKKTKDTNEWNSTVVEPSFDVPLVPLPKAFVALAETVAWHRGPEKWDVLYRLAWRLTRGGADGGSDRGLLSRASDDNVASADRMARAVRRDAHKMHAFVRFRAVDDGDAIDGQRYLAFHRPSHPIIRRESPWFAKRFPRMSWSILTPDGSAAWDGSQLVFGPPASADDVPRDDAVESLWLTYYASIFNRSRLNLRAMHKEMPQKYWRTMPETRLIPDLIAGAVSTPRTPPHAAAEPGLVGEAAGTPSNPTRAAARRSAPVADVPAGLSLPQLREASATCTACRLCEVGTQVVFGEGPSRADIVLVGEQPGDVEDQMGKPFVGPAGQLLSDFMQDVGLDRSRVYLTNAVKHFSFEWRGKRRIHRKATVAEQRACQPWLNAELAAIQPKVIVCLGATAAQNVIGRLFKLTQNLGQTVVSPYAAMTIATYHPSAILRTRAVDAERGEAQAQQLHDDLRRAMELAK